MRPQQAKLDHTAGKFLAPSEPSWEAPNASRGPGALARYLMHASNHRLIASGSHPMSPLKCWRPTQAKKGYAARGRITNFNSGLRMLQQDWLIYMTKHRSEVIQLPTHLWIRIEWWGADLSAPRWKSLKREALGPKKLAGLSDYICITAYQNSSVLIAKPFEAVQAQVNSVLTRVLVTSIC